jgi:fructose-1,6-bisphosphatase/inositol monophosphatase family enzyme
MGTLVPVFTPLAASEHDAVAVLLHRSLVSWYESKLGQGARFGDRPEPFRLIPEVYAALDPGEALAALSFPPHVAADAPAVADFLRILPQVHSVRRTGSTALNLAWLACGRLHAFWVRKIACWDVAAGLLIVREAGAAVGRCTADATPGEAVPLDAPGLLAASSPELFAAIRGMLHPQA